MTDIDSDIDSNGASRRALLKGAVGAGVGLAAWSAPKIGSIPAYALTTSTGVFNGTCYYVSFRSRNATATNSETAWWNRSNSTLPSVDQGRASNINRGTAPNPLEPRIIPDATYTWAGIFPDGSDLVVDANGDPRLPAGSASITLTTAPAGCVFETDTPAAPARVNGDYAPNIAAGTCLPQGTPQASTYTLISGTEIQLSGVVQDSRNNVVHFNINCQP